MKRLWTAVSRNGRDSEVVNDDRYTKPRGKAPDYSSPVVLRRNRSTVEDFCNAIHKEIAKQFKNGMSKVLFPLRTKRCHGSSDIAPYQSPVPHLPQLICHPICHSVLRPSMIHEQAVLVSSLTRQRTYGAAQPNIEGNVLG